MAPISLRSEILVTGIGFSRARSPRERLQQSANLGEIGVDPAVKEEEVK